MDMTPEHINGIYGIVGILIGSILTAVFTHLVNKKNKELKKLVFRLSKPNKLIVVDGSVVGDVEIIVRGRKAESASSVNYSITNTGNAVINDIKIKLELDYSAEIIGTTDTEFNVDGLTSDHIHYSYNNGDFNGLIIEVAYMNPGMVISGVLQFANIPKTLETYYSSPGVDFKVLEENNLFKQNIYSNVVFELSKSNLFMDLLMRISSKSYRRLRESEEYESMKSISHDNKSK